MQCTDYVKVSIFPNFINNLPDFIIIFPNLFIIIFPDLRELDNHNFHIVCIRPLRKRSTVS